LHALVSSRTLFVRVASRMEEIMTIKIGTWIRALTAIAVLAIPGRATAQSQKSTPYPYVLVDLGTFGGPQSTLVNGPYRVLTNSGAVVGAADTMLSDPYYPNNNPLFGYYPSPDPYLQHGFVWHDGALTDLGALPGTNSSAAEWINARGEVIGFSNNGTVDPLLGVAEIEGVLWREGRLVPLGTLGGNESMALAINDPGRVAGMAANTVPDPFSMAGWGTQTRAFLWQQGQMRDLGTLGGPDAIAFFVNARGQVAGESYTNSTPNPATPLLLGEGVPPTGAPTHDPFLWQDGHMQDLGTLGGTLALVYWLNNRGEVVGQSNLRGDQTFHPYLWDGRSLKDLGTLGGDFGSANWINDFGVVAGWATTPGNATAHAVLWRHGTLTDLGTVPGQPCSFANNVNVRGQVVGGSCTPDGNGWLWEHGTITDLNTLVAPTALHLTEAHLINDRGEIALTGVLPNGNRHAVLLIPAQLAALEGLTSNAPAPGAVTPAATPRAMAASCATLPSWRALLLRRDRRSCVGG
jgi:probable HAF family extracellular repeat protein